HAVREAAREALEPAAARAQMVAGVSYRGDHERRAGSPRRGHSEDVRVEAIGVDHLDAPPPEVPAELELAAHGGGPVEPVDRILGDRAALVLDPLQELADPAQAGQVHLEAGAI